MDAGYGTPGEASRCDGTPSPPQSQCNYAAAAKDIQAVISDILQYRAPNVRGNATETHILMNFGDDVRPPTPSNQPAHPRTMQPYSDSCLAPVGPHLCARLAV